MGRVFLGILAVWFTVTPVWSGEWILGPRPAPPQGPGPGELVAWPVGTERTQRLRFAEPHSPAGNSFYPALDAVRGRVFVPTAGGRTVVFSAADLSMEGSMTSIEGGRVAGVSPDGSVLVVVSAGQTAGYSPASRERQWLVEGGGSALAFDEDSRFAYVGGNGNHSILRVDLSSGARDGHHPVARSGDLVRIRQHLFSADMKTGVVSVLDLNSGEITAIATPEVDPQFDYRNPYAASAGLMQLAADSQAQRVYAAGLSGNILVFDSDAARYLGAIPVDAGPPGGPDKLSGLALFDQGRKALVTVENLGLAVVVDLETQEIVHTLPDANANRWLGVDVP